MRIALITDTHLARSAPGYVANTAATLRWIDGQGGDLAVHLGDITADGVEDASHFADAREVLSRLATPLRLIPGNHDIGDNPTPGVRTGQKLVQPDRLALYRELFGEDYWACDAAGWTLLGLNAQLFAMDDAEEAAQFDWLRRTLEETPGPVGLMIHKPLFRTGRHDAEIHHRYVPHGPRARLLDLLEGHDLRFVVSGHTHQLRRMEVDGVEHVWAPSCAYVFPDTMQERIGEKVVGAMSLDLTPAGHSFAFHGPSGVAEQALAAP